MADHETSHCKFPSLLILLQGLLLILFVVFVEYDPETLPEAKNPTIIDAKYPVFQDVHTFVLVGFGLLMIFLKKYGFSGLGYTFLISGVTMQWAAIMDGLLNLKNYKIQIGMDSLITGDLAAVTVIVTFGAVLGKTSNLQLLVIAFFEVIYYITNKNICTKYLQAVDPGGSMYIHMFGSFFGLMIARVLYHERAVAHDNETSRYTSDIFAALGTLFLWVCWPSLNVVLLDGTLRYRAIINTYYAMVTSCVTAFGLSSLTAKGSKLSMVHIQNATLAGGVTIGSIAGMIIQPWGAILIGIVGAIVSTLGYKYLQPFLIKKLYIHDTCGVSSLHGLPGVIAGIASIIASSMASYSTYKTSVLHYRHVQYIPESIPLSTLLFHRILLAEQYLGFVYVVYTSPISNHNSINFIVPWLSAIIAVFPARAPTLNSTQYFQWVNSVPDASGGLGRSASVQAGCQLAALIVTMAIALLGGTITGFVVKQSFFSPLMAEVLLYTDRYFWEVPADYPALPNSGFPITSPVFYTKTNDTMLLQDVTENTANMSKQ